MADLLDSTSLQARLQSVPKWQKDGDSIRRAFDFPAFPDGIEFVRKVADLAEAANHHPEIDIRWRTVKLVLSTHSAGGLTRLDFDLAERIDALV